MRQCSVQQTVKPKIGLTSLLHQVNVNATLKTKEEIQTTVESIQVFSNDDKNNEV